MTTHNISIPISNSSVERARELDLTPISTELLFVVAISVLYGRSYLGFERRRTCTGTLIARNYVLTLATCVITDSTGDTDPSYITILERPSGNELKAFKTHIYPNYHSADSKISKASDICLIEVTTSVQKDFPELPKNVENISEIKNTCTVASYGVDVKKMFDIRNFALFRMNQTNVTVFTGRICSDKRQFCIHFPDIKPCEADFGAPFICDNVLQGVHVPGWQAYNYYSDSCRESYISTFLAVREVTAWLEQTTQATTSKLEWLNNPWYVLGLCLLIFLVIGTIYYLLVEVLHRQLDPGTSRQGSQYDEDEWLGEEVWYERHMSMGYAR